MIRVRKEVHDAIWGLIGIALAAGWVAWALLSGGNVFLTVMVVSSIVLAGGAVVLLKRDTTEKPKE